MLTALAVVGYAQNAAYIGKNFLKITVITIVDGIANNETNVHLLENNIPLSKCSGKIKNEFFLQKTKIILWGFR